MSFYGCVLCRQGLGAEDGGPPRLLNRRERLEAEILVGIAPLLVADMRRPFFRYDYCH